jgi:hypothetical protein
MNPFRSLAPALLAGGRALDQVWIYIVGPLIGAVIAVLLTCLLGSRVHPYAYNKATGTHNIIAPSFSFETVWRCAAHNITDHAVCGARTRTSHQEAAGRVQRTWRSGRWMSLLMTGAKSTSGERRGSVFLVVVINTHSTSYVHNLGRGDLESLSRRRRRRW